MERPLFCTLLAVSRGFCKADQIGQVLVDPDRPAKHKILHGWVDGLAVNTTDPFMAVNSYAVERTGYYCLRLANPNAGTLSV